MTVTWKSDELKPGSDFSNIKKLVGTFEPFTEGRWGEQSAYGDNPYVQVNLCNVQILEMVGDVPPPELNEDKFAYRISPSERLNTKWDAFLKACENLKIELPDGIDGKRAILEQIPTGRGKRASTVLAPISLVEEVRVDPIGKVRELLANSTNVRIFKRACMLDPTINKDNKLVDKITSGAIFEELGIKVEGDLFIK